MTEFRLELHTGIRDTAGLVCGNQDLTTWLVRHSAASHRADVARTYLAIDGERVVGYFSITTGSIRPEDAPKKFARGMPRYPIGTILLARLAVDSRYHRRRVGSRLLAEALRRAVDASDAAAARLVVVDAVYDRAVDFYRRWGFVDTPENLRRLYRKMSDIRASLDSE